MCCVLNLERFILVRVVRENPLDFIFFCGLPLFHKALLKQGLFFLNTISTNSYRAAMDLGN